MMRVVAWFAIAIVCIVAPACVLLWLLNERREEAKLRKLGLGQGTSHV